MNTREINILLTQFFDGQTSLEEEKALKAYFLSGNVADKHKQYIPLFSFYNEDKNETILSDSFDEKIMNQISQAEIVPMYQNKRFWYYFSGIAASILFVIALFFESANYFNPNDAFTNSGYSKEEAQIAYKQTKKALAYISSTYSTAVKPLEIVSKFNKSTLPFNNLAKFNKGLIPLNTNVNKMNASVKNLSKLSKFTIIVKP